MSLATWLAHRWVAGETVESAVAATRAANRQKARTLLNCIGEHLADKADVEDAVGLHLEILEQIHRKHLKADVSLKLTQIGLEIGTAYCRANLDELLHRAAEVNAAVWIDMEGPRYIPDTISLYLTLTKKYGNLCITLQANQQRTGKDMEKILRRNGRIRLVKGAYPGDYAHADTLRHRYSQLMTHLFRNGNRFAIATHDQILIDGAKLLAYRYRRQFEFQVLRGVRNDLRNRLIREKYRVAEYTPFGRHPLAYVWRRWKEHSSALALFR